MLVSELLVILYFLKERTISSCNTPGGYVCPQLKLRLSKELLLISTIADRLWKDFNLIVNSFGGYLWFQYY